MLAPQHRVIRGSLLIGKSTLGVTEVGRRLWPVGQQALVGHAIAGRVVHLEAEKRPRGLLLLVLFAFLRVLELVLVFVVIFVDVVVVGVGVAGVQRRILERKLG